jgi:hypothetical protein
MTASTASIPVLHSAEVVPFTHKSCHPSATGLYGPHTPLPRKQDRVTLRGLYLVPLASENPLQFLGRAMQQFPFDRHRSKINPGTSLHAYSPTALAHIG